MKIYLIRHGQTEWNVMKKLQGWNNSELTEKGIEDAKNLSERLKDIDFDIIYSSPQKRALDTAKIIKANRDMEIITLEELKEIRFGVWQGMTLEKVKEKYPREYDDYFNRPHLYKPIGDGESLKDIYQRAEKAYKKILNSKAENVLVVSHGVTLKALRAIVKNISLEEFSQLEVHPGTALNIIEKKNGKIQLVLEGDTSHMDI